MHWGYRGSCLNNYSTICDRMSGKRRLVTVTVFQPVPQNSSYESHTGVSPRDQMRPKEGSHRRRGTMHLHGEHEVRGEEEVRVVDGQLRPLKLHSNLVQLHAQQRRELVGHVRADGRRQQVREIAQIRRRTLEREVVTVKARPRSRSGVQRSVRHRGVPSDPHASTTSALPF